MTRFIFITILVLAWVIPSALSQPNQILPTLTLVTSSRAIAFGQSLDLTISVTSTTSTTYRPTGRVLFYLAPQFLEDQNADQNFNNTYIVATSFISQLGTASVHVTPSKSGTFVASATYSGDDKFLPSSTTSSTTLQVSPSPTTLSVSAPDSVMYGRVLTVTATISSQISQGTVDLLVDSTEHQSLLVGQNGVVSFKICGLDQGRHSLDLSFTDSTGALLPSYTSTLVQVTKDGASRLEVTSNNNPSVYGEDVVLSVRLVQTVTGGEVCPSSALENKGSIDVYEATHLFGTFPFDQSYTALVPLPKSLSRLSHYFRFVYDDSSNYLPIYAEFSQVVLNADSTLVVDSPRISEYGRRVVFTLSVEGPLDVAGATGEIKYILNNQIIDGASIRVSNGRGTLSICTLDLGTHNFEFFYAGGDGLFNSSTSTQIQIVPGPSVIESRPFPQSAIVGEEVFLQTSVRSSDGCGEALGEVVVYLINDPRNGRNLTEISRKSLREVDSGISIFDLSSIVSGVADYFFSVTYSGFNKFSPSNSTFSVNVRRGKTTIGYKMTPDAGELTGMTEVMIQGIFYNEPRAKGQEVRGKASFYLADKFLGAVPIKRNVATIYTNYTPSAPKVLQVSYRGNQVFEATTASFYLSV